MLHVFSLVCILFYCNHALPLRAICSAFYGVILESQISNLKSLSQALFASICAYISTWPDQPSVSPAMAFISYSACHDMVLENLFNGVFSSATRFYLIACCYFSLCFNVCYGVNITAVLSAKQCSSARWSNDILCFSLLFTASLQHLHE
jgi:hypothetical protein